MRLSEIRRTIGLGPVEVDYDVLGCCDLFDMAHDEQGWVTWLAERNLESLTTDICKTVICTGNAVGHPRLVGASLLVVSNPRAAFRQVLGLFDEDDTTPGIDESARVDSTVSFGSGCSIGANVVIEKGALIGDHVTIGHNTVVRRRTIVGNNVKIGSNCTIGGVGFGYERNEEGAYDFIPHIGNVVIEDGVEIGNNSCVDRAVVGSTRLRKNCRIDNLVHISHGCDIGVDCLVIANAMIAGSVKLGKGCWVAPSSSVLNQKTVGAGVTIGMGAVVLKDIAEGDVVVGNPARSIRN